MEKNKSITEFTEDEYKEFFSWIFDKEISTLEKEYDVSRGLDLENSYIYYTPEIKGFFETKAMQRLGKVGQIPNVSLSNANCVQNRLEHCKGAYQKILDFYMLQFQNSNWREKNSSKTSKLKVLADMMDMASHDIGHNIGSHALEHLIGKKGAHEVVGDRILYENEEVVDALLTIHPDLLDYLDFVKKQKYNLHSLKEGNIDFDRADFLSRDTLYFESENGFYEDGDSIPIILDRINKGCRTFLIQNEGKEFECPIYSYEVVPDIEMLLKRRRDGYENIYISKTTKSNDHILEEFCRSFLKSDEPGVGKGLKAFLEHLSNSSIEHIDLDLFLDWNDIKFYNSIFDIAENSKDENLRRFARLCIPPVEAMVGMVQTRLFPTITPKLDEAGNEINLENEFQDEEDRKFYLKVKSIIETQDERYYNNGLEEECYGVSFENEEDRKKFLETLTETYGVSKKGINSLIQWRALIRPYNPEEPIFILGKDKKVYTLDDYPERTMELKPYIVYGAFGVEAKSLLEGVKPEEVEKMKFAFDVNVNKIDFSNVQKDTRLFSEMLDKKEDKDAR